MDIGNYSLSRLGFVKSDELSNKTKVPNANDKVMDLSSIEDIKTQNLSLVDTLKIKQDGKDVFLSISSIPQENRAEFIQQLKGKIMDASSSKDFNLNEFVKLTDSGNNLKVGVDFQKTEVKLSGEIVNSQKLVNDMNASGDKTWKFLNGNADFVTVPAGQSKPNEWYNYYAINDDGNLVKYDKSNSSKGEVAVRDIDPQQFIQNNLNANGVFTMIDQLMKDKAGLDSFIKNLPNDELKNTKIESGADLLYVILKASDVNGSFKGSNDDLKAVSKEIFSYATTGKDTKGNTDFAQLQAILHSLGGEVSKTASSNTHFKGPEFQVGNMTLKEGDGRLGRATYLEMLHIAGNLVKENSNASSLNIGITNPTMARNTLLIDYGDVSGSAADDAYFDVSNGGGFNESIDMMMAAQNDPTLNSKVIIGAFKDNAELAHRDITIDDILGGNYKNQNFVSITEVVSSDSKNANMESINKMKDTLKNTTTGGSVDESSTMGALFVISKLLNEKDNLEYGNKILRFFSDEPDQGSIQKLDLLFDVMNKIESSNTEPLSKLKGMEVVFKWSKEPGSPEVTLNDFMDFTKKFNVVNSEGKIDFAKLEALGVVKTGTGGKEGKGLDWQSMHHLLNTTRMIENSGLSNTIMKNGSLDIETLNKFGKDSQINENFLNFAKENFSTNGKLDFDALNKGGFISSSTGSINWTKADALMSKDGFGEFLDAIKPFNINFADLKQLGVVGNSSTNIFNKANGESLVKNLNDLSGANALGMVSTNNKIDPDKLQKFNYKEITGNLYGSTKQESLVNKDTLESFTKIMGKYNLIKDGQPDYGKLEKLGLMESDGQIDWKRVASLVKLDSQGGLDKFSEEVKSKTSKKPVNELSPEKFQSAGFISTTGSFLSITSSAYIKKFPAVN